MEIMKMENKKNKKRLIKILALCLGLSVAQVSQAYELKKYIVPTVIAAGVVVTGLVLYKIFKGSAEKDKPVENRKEQANQTQPKKSQKKEEETTKVEEEKEQEPVVEKKENTEAREEETKKEEEQPVCDKYEKLRKGVYKWFEKAESMRRELRAKRGAATLTGDKTICKEATENMRALDKQEKDFWEKLVKKYGSTKELMEKLIRIFTPAGTITKDIWHKNNEIKKQIRAVKERLEK